MIQLIFSIIYRKKLFDKEKKTKLKHSTLYYGYENGAIKNVDLKNKITSMQCSWVKRLFKDDFYDWKIITLFLIGKHLDTRNDIFSKFPSFYQDIFHKVDN